MNAVEQLTRAGVSMWLDERLPAPATGSSLAWMIRERSITGITISVPAAGCRAAADARQACDDLRPLFEATRGDDGYASIEVDSRGIDDPGRTVADARRVAGLVGRPNLMVRIPATDTGLAAMTACLAEGIGVHVAVILGLHRYAGVIDAFMDGLQSLRLSGGDLRGVASVASFPVSRRGVESAIRVYGLFAQSLLLPRWLTLAADGARPQRPAWSLVPGGDGSPDRVAELALPGAVLIVSRAMLEDLARTPARGSAGAAVRAAGVRSVARGSG